MIKIFKKLPFLQTIGAILFLLLQTATILYLPYITKDIVSEGIMNGDVSYVWRKGLFMLVITVIGLMSALLNTLIFSKLSYKLGGQLRSELYQKIMNFSRYEFDQFGTSTLITRNTNDVTQVQILVEMSLKFLLMAPIMLIGGIGMTYLLNPKLSLVFVATLPVLLVSYFIIYHYANPLYVQMQQSLDKLNLSFREGLIGARVIRAFRKDSIEYKKYKAINQKYTKTSITAETIMCFFIPLITLIINFSMIGIVWLVGQGVQTGATQIGDIVACIGYASQILIAISLVTSVITTIPKGQTSSKRIYEVLDRPLSIQDRGIQSIPEKVSLMFKHVDFRYQGAKQKTLQDINFSVKAGQTLAIIGSTGDGKSSIVNLISRMYDVEKGAVFIDGIDVREIEEAKLHDLVSVSPQKSTLFFGTIRSNMLIACPKASDEDIWHALKMAQAYDFVNSLKDGLDSIVEKEGGNFSGGQRQRLCIARTLLKKAEIYVFDDSFSALDFQTDLNVRNAIKASLTNVITVIVAQRINTVIEADRILVMDDGKIVGQGTHDELKKNNHLYNEILESQCYEGGMTQ